MGDASHRGATPKELAVLDAVGRRLTNAEIAARLYVSERTIESHVSSLLRKYQVTSRRDLVRIAGARSAAEAGPDALPAALRYSSRSGPFVGRADALDDLATVWTSVRSGRSRAVLITGEAGIGKTRLVAELALIVHASGGHVLAGACHEDTATPFEPFEHLLDHTREAPHVGFDEPIDGVVFSAAQFDAATQLARVLASLRERVAEEAARRPLMLVVDDVHWAAHSTRTALRDLVHRVDGTPLLIAITSRIGAPDVSPDTAVFLAELARTPDLVTLQLDGLDEDDILTLARSKHRRVVAAAVRAETGGNPLLIGEVLSGSAPRTGSSVEGLLLSRSRRLGLADNELLDLAAVLGAEFDLAILANAGERSTLDAVTALARCELAGLVRADPERAGRYAFVHALFRSVRLSALPAGTRMRFHLQVAQALRRVGSSRGHLSALARHTAAAAPLGDLDDAIACALRAADAAGAALAFDEAAEMCQLGLRVADLREAGSDDERCLLLVRLGHFLNQLHDQSAREILLEAANLGRAVGRLDVVAEAAWAMTPFRGMFSFDPQLLELVQSVLDQSPPAASVRARLLCVLAVHAAGLRDPEQRHALMTEAIRAARETDDPLLLIHVLTWHWTATMHPGTLIERIAVTDEILAIASDRMPFFELNARASRCTGFLELGDIAAAAREAEAVERMAANRHDLFARPGILYRRAGSLFLEGDLIGAERTANELLALASQLPQTRPDAMVLFGSHLVNIRLHQGRAAELLSLAAGFAADRPDVPVARAVLAMVSARAGDPEAARAIVAELVPPTGLRVPPDVGWYLGVTALADAVHVLGDVRAASALERALKPYAGRFAVQGAAALLPIDVARAQLALTTGRAHHAVRLAAASARHTSSPSAPIFTGRALVVEAAGRRATGDEDGCQRVVAEALSIADRTGGLLIRHEVVRYGLVSSDGTLDGTRSQ